MAISGKDLTVGPLSGSVFRFALPYMAAYMLQVLYGLADLFFVGLYGSVDDTTAVANGAQVMYMFSVITIGLAMGATVRTGLAVGSGDGRGLRLVVCNTATLFSLYAVVCAIALYLSCGHIVRLIGTPAEAVAGAESYLRVCFLGIPFIVAYNVIAAIFRGLGDSKTPMWVVAVACAVNVALDFALIGRLGMGPRGAALATTLSQAAAVVFALMMIRRRNAFNLRQGAAPFTKHFFHRPTLAALLRTGVPVALQDGCIQFSFLAIMMIANGRGLADAAAVGIVEKFIGLLFIVPSAMLAAVSAISAQSIGAGKPDRARQSMRFCALLAVAFGLTASVFLQFFPDKAVEIFTSNERATLLGAQYLQSYVWDCLLAGVHFCFSGYFTACGFAVISFAHNVVSIALVRLPMAYLLSAAHPESLFPMGWASPAGSLLSVFICVGAYAYLSRRGKLPH